MKMLRIWILAAVILAYSVYTAVGISREFDGLQMRNETICRLNWEIRPGLMYTDIIPISGSGNYIVNEGGGGQEYSIIDRYEQQQGEDRKYDCLKDLGNGFVKYKIIRRGYIPEGEKRGDYTGILDSSGNEVTLEEYEAAAGGTIRSGKNTAFRVSRGGCGGKYFGISDNEGAWLVPPVFDNIEISGDGEKATLYSVKAAGVISLKKQSETLPRQERAAPEGLSKAGELHDE